MYRWFGGACSAAVVDTLDILEARTEGDARRGSVSARRDAARASGTARPWAVNARCACNWRSDGASPSSAALEPDAETTVGERRFAINAKEMTGRHTNIDDEISKIYPITAVKTASHREAHAHRDASRRARTT